MVMRLNLSKIKAATRKATSVGMAAAPKPAKGACTRSPSKVETSTTPS